MTLSKPLTAALDSLVSQLIASLTHYQGAFAESTTAGHRGFTQAQATALVKRGLAVGVQRDGLLQYRVSGRGLALRADYVETECAHIKDSGDDLKQSQHEGFRAAGQCQVDGVSAARLMLSLAQGT